MDDDEGISFTASLIDDLVSMDENTKLQRRLDYVRVCMLVSATLDLPTKVVLM